MTIMFAGAGIGTFLTGAFSDRYEEMWKYMLQFNVGLLRYFKSKMLQGNNNYLFNRFGRKRTVIFLAVFYLLGGTLAAAAPYFWVFCLGKFIMGLTDNGIYVSGFIIC